MGFLSEPHNGTSSSRSAATSSCRAVTADGEERQEQTGFCYWRWMATGWTECIVGPTYHTTTPLRTPHRWCCSSDWVLVSFGCPDLTDAHGYRRSSAAAGSDNSLLVNMTAVPARRSRLCQTYDLREPVVFARFSETTKIGHWRLAMTPDQACRHIRSPPSPISAGVFCQAAVPLRTTTPPHHRCRKRRVSWPLPPLPGEIPSVQAGRAVAPAG